MRRKSLVRVELLIARLRSGRSVSIHCRAGIGRSGMLVCVLLVCQGRNGPRKLDSALSEIFLRFQAANLTLA